ncbi:MAG: hypothetical protein CL902_00005 [Dehalococcoidia bacterium]|nr:hypothetical protein [Dehalococcoidia bacterium]|tara:strand:- start:160 stop:741 length:582 start_codon:yes stop_codon:yes gene_type:complete
MAATLKRAPVVLLQNDRVAFRLATKSAKEDAPLTFQVVDLTCHKVDAATVYHGNQCITPAFLAGMTRLMLRPELTTEQVGRILSPEYLEMLAAIRDGKHGNVKQYHAAPVVVSASEREAIQRAEAAEKDAADTKKTLDAILREMAELKRETARASRPAPTAPTAPTLANLVGQPEVEPEKRTGLAALLGGAWD